MGKKRATGETGMAPSATSGYSKGMSAVSDGGSHPSSAGNPKTGMGVGSKSDNRISQGGDPGGFAAGRSRTNRGKNSTGSGPQGMRG